MICKEESQRLSILRFPLIVGVVFIHAYATNIGLSGGSIGIVQNNFITDFIRNVISQGFARTAVPLFFLMSGYFFFLDFDPSIKMYFKKIKDRIRTLLIPFLLWNCATLFLISIAQVIPATQSFFSGVNSQIASYTVFEYIRNIFGLGKEPIAGHFWFIRDLMLIVLLTPIINFVSTRIPILYSIILFGCWILNYWPVYAPSTSAVLFFSIGAMFAIHNKSLFVFDKHGIVITAIYVPIVIIGALLNQELFAPTLHKIGIVFGIISMLFLTKLAIISHYLKNMLLSLSETSFFVFAAHYTLIIAIQKLAYKVLMPQSWMSILTLYFSLPIFVIILLVFVYHILSRKAPGFIGILTGGRIVKFKQN